MLFKSTGSFVMKNFAVTAVAASLLLLAGCASGPGAVATKKPSDNYIDCSTVMQSGVYKGTCDVTCSVNALAINFDSIQASRACSTPPRKVTVELAPTAVSGRWLGKMQGVQPEDPTRFEVVPNAKGGGSAARTPFGWFAVDEMKISGDAMRVRIDADRQLRPTAADAQIISRAINLLPDVASWNKNDNRECPPEQKKLSMFCALMQATTEISGGIHYRQPALQSVREVLNTVDARRIKTHRIMDYNNHPDTTLQEIHTLLRQAQAKVEKDF
jgi:hypothetical protein